MCVEAALVDTAGGRLSIALAGECLAWRVRAASCEQLAIQQPPLGSSVGCKYLGHSLDLSLRERMVMVAHDAAHHGPPFESAIAQSFFAPARGVALADDGTGRRQPGALDRCARVEGRRRLVTQHRHHAAQVKRESPSVSPDNKRSVLGRPEIAKQFGQLACR